MKKVTLVARLLMGFVFFAGGIAFFFTTPPPLQGPMADFFKGMMATKYFFLLLKGTEIACGLTLLTNRFVPLALVVLAPIILNIFLVHAFLDPSGLVVASLLMVIEIYLGFFSPEYSPTLRHALFRP